MESPPLYRAPPAPAPRPLPGQDGQTGSTNNTMHTMQTILRLGSVAETKVTNGGRISVGSMGGNSLQSGGSSCSSAVTGLTRVPSTSPAETVSDRPMKQSVCSIAEKETDEESDGGTGRLFAETSFVSVTAGGTTLSDMKSTGKQKHVRISTGSTPEDDSVFPKSRNGCDCPGNTVADFEHDISESTPFCP